MPSPFTRSADDFWAQYAAWQESLNKYYYNFMSSPDAGKIADATISSSLSNADIINTLPYSDSKKFKESFRTSVLGLNTGFMDEPGLFYEIGKDRDSGIHIGAFMGQEDHPLSSVLRSLSINQDPIAEAAERYRVSGNIPTLNWAKHSASPSSQIPIGRRILVFDTETLGLATDAAAVREISDMMLARTDAGFSLGRANTGHIKVGRSGLGSIYDAKSRSMVRMDDFIERTLAGGNALARPGEGRAFVETVMPSVQRMVDADFIAGHNVGFDIKQILGNLMRTSDYLNDETVNEIPVKQLVDELRAKVGRNEIIDTQKLVKDYFVSKGKNGMPQLAREMSAAGEIRAFSLENLMLQTNLPRLLHEDLGGDFIDTIVTKGMHGAEIDTTVTAKLIEYVESARLKKGELGTGTAKWERLLRRKVLGSHALTPVTNLSNAADISPENFARLYEEARTGKKPEVLRIFSSKDGSEIPLRRATADEWYETLTNSSDPRYMDVYAGIKFTPMEQHIWETRKLLHEQSAAASPGSIVDHFGQWNQYSGINRTDGGILGRLETILKRAQIPDDTTFGLLQERLARAGMPFAGLPLEERILTGALSSSARVGSFSKDIKAIPEGKLVDIGDDLGISWYKEQAEFLVGDQRNVASIPFNLILEAEKAKVINTGFLDDKRLTTLGISTVESSRSINFSINLAHEESTDFINWLESAANSEDEEIQGLIDQALRADDPKNPRKIHSVIADLRSMHEAGKLDENGINIGYLNGESGRRFHHELSNLLQDLTRDRDKIPFRAIHRGRADAGIGQIAAVIHDRSLTKEETSSFLSDLALQRERTAAALRELPNRGSLARATAGYMGRTQVSRLTKRADNIYGALTSKKTGFTLGAAALVFGGYYAYKKHKTQSQYDESIDSMDYESSRDYSNYRQDMGMSSAPATRRMDPLLTAGVVGNLDRNAIGHTNMSSNKNMDLFSGV